MTTDPNKSKPILVRREIPDGHLVTILIFFVLDVVCILLWYFAPPDKAQNLWNLVLFFSSFLGGKLTNQFGKPLMTKRATDRKSDEQSRERDQ